MRILCIDVNHMHVNEHFQFYRAVAGAIERRGGAGALGIAPRFAEFSARLAREDEALNKIRKSALTERIRAASKARGRLYVSMVGITRAYLRHYDPEVVDAARRLKIVFGAYGNIPKLPLIEQTSAAYNVLQELRGGYAADCAVVGLTGWVERFALENGEVDRLITERIAETAAKTDIVLAKARREVDEAYARLRDVLFARAVLGGEPGAVCAEFIRALNEIIRKYISTHRRRGQPPVEGEAESAPQPGSSESLSSTP